MSDNFKKAVEDRVEKLKAIRGFYQEGIVNLTKAQEVNLVREINILENLLSLDKK
jgi:hypothetical protein